MWWWAVAWGSPAAGYAFEEMGGGVVFDAVGAAHGCLEGPVGRIDGRHGAGLAFDGTGGLVAAMTTAPDMLSRSVNDPGSYPMRSRSLATRSRMACL